MKLLAVYKCHPDVLIVPHSRTFSIQGSNIVLFGNIEKYNWAGSRRINKPS